MKLRRRNEQQTSLFDGLTGLVGRAALVDRAQHALDRRQRYGATVAVLFIDIDDFRAVNTSLGWKTGDKLLRAAAARLLGVLRSADTLGRTGGDDFAVVLEDLTSPTEAYDVGTRLLTAMEDPFDLDGVEVSVSVSLGIAVATGEESAEELLAQAGTALDRARDHGDGRYAVFETGMLAAARSRLALRGELRNAVADGQLVPWYQPLVVLADGITVGVEALARWHHPTRGTILPGEFLPLAERSPAIVAIDAAILAQAARDGSKWPGGISVNMAARTLEEPGLAARVASTIEAAGLAPERLTIEITEHSLIVDNAEARAALTELRRLGVSIALDDFGVGHSSLTYLERFPVDRLKIDRSFVSRLGDPEGRKLVAAIVAMAKSLGLGMVAEGIETRQQRDVLIEIGCPMGQGYLLGRPAPAAALGAAARSITRATS